jgi:hypothetical protein
MRHPPPPNRCYITPRSYLDLLQQYSALLASGAAELGDKRRRLLHGIARLQDTNASLDAMRVQLSELQPQLADKTATTSTLLAQVGAPRDMRTLLREGDVTGRAHTPLAPAPAVANRCKWSRARRRQSRAWSQQRRRRCRPRQPPAST